MHRCVPVFALLPLLCWCQLYKAPASTSYEGNDVSDAYHISNFHDGVPRKMYEVADLMKQAQLRFGNNYETQRDELEMRIINFSQDEIARDAGTRVCLVRALGGAHALVQDNVVALHDHAGYVNVEFVTILPAIDGFINVEVTVIASQTLFLVNFETYSELLTVPPGGNWSSVAHVQSLTHSQHRPVASKFVHCAGSVYLVVAYGDMHGGAVSTLVYQWTGSLMDEIQSLPTIGAVDLAIINQPDHFYIAVAERPAGSEKQTISIFVVASGGVVGRQRIAVAFPRRLFSYSDYHDQLEEFLLIIDDTGLVTVLKLEGDEFVFHYTARLPNPPTVATVAYLEAVPVLCTAHENNIHLNKLTSKGLQREQVIYVEGSKVSALAVFEAENGLYSVVAAADAGKRMVITVTNLAVRRSILVGPMAPDPVDECLFHLSRELEAKQNVIDEMSAKIKSMDEVQDIIFNDNLVLNHEVTLALTKLGELNVKTNNSLALGEEDIVYTGQEIQNKLKLLEDALLQFVYKDESIVVDFPVVVKEKISANKLEASTVFTKLLNGDEFNVNNFLMEGMGMEIDSHVFEELHVNNLLAPKIFLDGLKDSSINTLQVNNIYVPSSEKINGILLEELVLADYAGYIDGHKIINNVKANDAVVTSIGETNIVKILSEPPKPQYLITSKNLYAENLEVKNVNGINFTAFLEGAFLKSIHNTVKGDLTFNNSVEITNLQTEEFQSLPVADIFTKTTDQIINAEIFADTVSFEKAKIGLVNGLDLSRDVVLTSKNSVIQSPVTINHMNVNGDLILECKDKPYCNLIDVKPDDLLQIYNAPVYINGSVTVQDLSFSSESSLSVGDEPFNTEIHKTYWVKGKEQVIPGKITFNAGLALPHLDVTSINYIPLDKLATLHSDLSTTTVQFERLEVNDFHINPQSDCSSICELSKNVVTTNGDFLISGKKTFLNNVAVKNLEVESINGINMNNIALVNELRLDKKFTGQIVVKKVEIKGDVHLYCDFDTNIVNKYPLQKVVAKAIRINEDVSLDSVLFTKSLQGENIFIQHGPTANGIRNIDDIHDSVNLTIHGDLETQSGIQQVNYINDINFDSYVSQIVDKNTDAVIGGTKTFSKGLRVNSNLDSKLVAGVNLKDVVEKALRKTGKQTVTGKHTIKTLYADTLITTLLNNVPIENMVNAGISPIVINSSLLLENAVIFGQLIAPPAFQLKAFSAISNNLEPACWAEVGVLGGVNWNVGGPINYILENAAHECHENVVTGGVTFAAPVQVENVFSNNFIQDVDIQYLATDAVLKSALDQVISGKKIFSSETTIDQLEVTGQSYFDEVTGVDFDYINSTYAKRNTDNYFEGHVNLYNVSAGSIRAKNIKGIPPLTSIVTIDSKEPIKSIEVTSARVRGDLSINNINNVRLSDFLQSIVLLEGDEQCVYGDIDFESLEIDNLETSYINGLNVTDLVFDIPGSEIIIDGTIIFTESIKIDGNTAIEYLNNIKLEEAYECSLKNDEDINVNGNLQISGGSTFASGISGKLEGIAIKEVFAKMVAEVDQKTDITVDLLNQINSDIISLKQRYSPAITQSYPTKEDQVMNSYSSDDNP